MRALLLFLLLGIPGVASAQYFDKMFFGSWNINQPLSNRDYAGKFSTRGARLAYYEVINEKLALGVDLLWASYDDYIPRQTYNYPTSSLTTDYFHYANNYGATLTGNYYFFEEQKFMPYVGFGAGVAYHEFKVYYNVFSSGENAFGLLLRPQAGVWMKLNERSNKALHAAVHFEYSSAKSQETGYRNFINAGVELGLIFLDW